MEGSDQQETAARLLRGWKDIAAYLGTSPRSAQRFAAELELPVHRTGRVRGAVSAFTTELDAWTRRKASGDINPADEGIEDAPGIPNPAAPAIPVARTSWAVAAIAAVVAVGVVGWLAVVAVQRADEQAPAQAETSAATTTAGRTFTLWMELYDGREVELKVVPGDRATVGIAPNAQLQFEAELRGERLHVTVYDLAAGATNGAPQQVAGVVDLVQSSRGARVAVQLQFAGGSLALAWLAPQS